MPFIDLPSACKRPKHPNCKWKGTTLRMTQLNPRYADLREYRQTKDGPRTATSAGGCSPTSQYWRGGCGKHIGSTVNWGRPSYQCRRCLKVSHQIQPVDDCMIEYVVKRLARNDAVSCDCASSSGGSATFIIVHIAIAAPCENATG